MIFGISEFNSKVYICGGLNRVRTTRNGQNP